MVAAPLQSFAGGVGGAAFIVAVYWLVLVRHERPLRGPAWWGAGLGLMAGTGAQIAVGIAEGAINGIQGATTPSWPKTTFSSPSSCWQP